MTAFARQHGPSNVPSITNTDSHLGIILHTTSIFQQRHHCDTLSKKIRCWEYRLHQIELFFLLQHNIEYIQIIIILIVSHVT